MKKKYWVHAVETVYYCAPVMAECEEEAWELADNGFIDWGEPCDSEDFEILEYTESEENPYD